MQPPKPYFLVFKIILEILISLFLLPILLILWAFNRTLRALLSIFLQLNYGSSLALVPHGADNVWGYRKQGNNRMCIIAMFSPIVLQDCSEQSSHDQALLEQHRKLWLERVIEKRGPGGGRPYEKLTKCFTTRFGYPCLRRQRGFDIKAHVRLMEGEEDIEEEQFLTKILPQMGQDMDETKPQWEEVIVPRVKSSEGLVMSVRIFRYHHGYMDGASANLLFANCMYDGDPSQFPHVIDLTLPPLKISRTKATLMRLYCAATGPYLMMKTLWRAAALRHAPFTTPAFTGKRHYAWSERVDAALLRHIKGRVDGASAPAILATATAAGIRRMGERYGRIQEGERVVLGMINAMLPYQGIHPRNQFTLTHFPLPLSSGEEGSSWSTLLREIDKQMRGILEDPSFYMTQAMFRFFGAAPSSCIQRMMRGAGNPISFSNVPMTRAEVSLWGKGVKEVVGWPPLLTNTGMGIIIMRYGGHIRFLAVADEGCISREELNYFLTQVVEEMKRMGNECGREGEHFDLGNMTKVASLIA